jgi:hypothetical protein
MTVTFTAWGVSAAILIGLAIVLGILVTREPLGLLIDSVGRYSLTQTQLAIWTITVLSLIAGVFIGRLWVGTPSPLGFDIPAAVLAVMGISVGSTLASNTQKALNVANHPDVVAASAPVDGFRPSLTQIFLQEQGTYADQVIDITKFQNFVITIIVVLAYTTIAVNALNSAGTPANFAGLPGFSGTLLVLLAISHGGYLAGKLPTPTGNPATLSAAGRANLTAAMAIPPTGGRRITGQMSKKNPAIYDLDHLPPTAIQAGKPLIVRGPRPFTLGVQTTTPAVSRTAYIPAAKIAANQWAAVAPTPGSPGQAGTLRIQVRDNPEDLTIPEAEPLEAKNYPQRDIALT